MQFVEVLKACVGQTVVINNGEERELVEVGEDFVVLKGGNPQMQITDFVPLGQIVKVIRAYYPSNDTSSISIDVTISGGDQRRAGGH